MCRNSLRIDNFYIKWKTNTTPYHGVSHQNFKHTKFILSQWSGTLRKINVNNWLTGISFAWVFICSQHIAINTGADIGSQHITTRLTTGSIFTFIYVRTQVWVLWMNLVTRTTWTLITMLLVFANVGTQIGVLTFINIWNKIKLTVKIQLLVCLSCRKIPLWNKIFLNQKP